MTTIVLANETLRLEFDRDTGALVHVATADGTWQLLDRPQLGLSFRLLVPLSGRRNNPVLRREAAPRQPRDRRRTVAASA